LGANVSVTEAQSLGTVVDPHIFVFPSTSRSNPDKREIFDSNQQRLIDITGALCG
jgi:hypothetical protein